MLNSNEIKERGEALWEMMPSCELCPRMCGAKRLEGKAGMCGANDALVVSSSHAHFGEESGLVGTKGSGTIFFSHCSLLCEFCLNCEISHGGEGRVHSIDELSSLMLRIQNMGCHNLNLVTPTHYVAHIVLALAEAASQGFNIPVVYNTSSWENLEVLKILDGIVDIYLADFKFFSPQMASKYARGAKTYPDIVKKAMIEMNRQVGTSKPDQVGLIHRGLMIRHLVMPNNSGDSLEIMNWISENLPKDTYINIMSQYSPCCLAYKHPEINRRITRSEYKAVVDRALELGLSNLDIQGIHSHY